MKKALALLVLVMLGLCGAATAQDWSFEVPSVLLSVYPNNDASVTLEYEVEFACEPGAHPIDTVDMGLPRKGYDIGNMRASVDGRPVDDIRVSTYIDCGVELHLGAGTIQPGESGVLHFEATMPRLVYQDTTRADYASLRITPTWWDASALVGSSKLGIVVYLPRSVKPEDVLHQGQPFTSKATTEKHTVVGWLMPSVRMDGPHMVALSFPKGQMQVVRQTKLDLFLKWWKESDEARALVGVVLLVLFGIMFFRASQGTGCSCFVVLLIGLILFFVTSPVGELLAIPGLALVWWMTEKGMRRKRGHYFPAVATVEGAGIKRGLTAPEAAALLEVPLGQVLALVIFGLLKKGVLEQVDADPLQVRLREPYAKGTKEAVQEAAAAAGTVVHEYELPFIRVLRDPGGRPVRELDFKSAMEAFIKATAERMKGFDVAKTREYYRGIVSKAWEDAKGLGDLEQRTQFTDDNLLWLMMGERWGDDFGTWHRTGYHYRPPWARTYGGGWAGGDSGGGATPSVPDVGGQTSLGDVAASFAGWSQNVAGGLASKLDGVAVQKAAGGIMNLSGVDKITMDVLEEMSKGGGGRGGGGGGGGCACACAGCACACACAGGGR